ncbi:putative TMhelix containing protein [Vibrio phage 277E43-1]|nr:putative TMhelix containing protein [Vibrio phage 277E43-1]
MAEAAGEAGLTMNGTVKEMFKLQEQGGLISATVLPVFARRMREAARENDALTKALDENLNPTLGRTLLTVQDLSEQMYKGMKPSLMFLLDGFNALGEDSRALAQGIGSVLGGALFGLTYPVRLVAAAVMDLRDIWVDTLGITDEAETKFYKLAGTVAGLAGSFLILAKALKMVKAASSAISGVGSKVGGSPKAGGGASGPSNKMSIGGKLGVAGGLFSTATAGMALYDRLSTTNERNANVFQMLEQGTAFKGGRIAEWMNSGKQQSQPVNIQIGVRDSELSSVIDVIATDAIGREYTDAYMNITGGRR